MLIPVTDWKELWDKRGVKIVVVSVTTTVLLSSVGLAGYHFWPEPEPTPPPSAETATEEEVRDYVAGDDFSRLSMDERVSWVEKRMKKASEADPEELREAWGKMDDESRQRVGENMRSVLMERMKRDVDEYGKLPESEKEAFLDKRIDEMQRFRQTAGRIMGGRGRRGPDRGDRSARQGRGDREGGRRDGDGARRQGRGPRGPGRMMARLAKMPADRRARVMSYRKAMISRMRERGMAPPGHSGRGNR